MAREGREKSSTGIYHVLLRGVDKLFLNEEDYAEFRERLSEYFGGKSHLLAFLLLPNRVHLLVDEGDVDLVYAIKPLCTSYARYFNRTYNADGKLFYDRFKSVPAETKEEIADTVAFFNAIGSEATDEENCSLYEYKNGAELCSTKRLISKIGSAGAVSTAPVSLHLDDYSQLSKEDMELYLRLCIGKNLKEVGNMDRSSDEFITLFSGRGISARAILPLFGILAKNSQKKAVSKKTEIKTEKAKPIEKNSVKETKTAKKEASSPPKAVPQKQETPEPTPVPKKDEAPQEERRQKRNLSVWLL